ncbi:MAG: Na+/H+ antiporter [Deltaproteobacteria bacterium]|nr:MAG: Na+/H+ antiporter [Deltaproteobacteria bacterium]
MGLGIEAQILWLLIIAAAVAMFTKHIRLPYTIALVAVGIVLGLLDLLPKMLLTPELVFHLFLPILLFEAAFNIDLLDLRDNGRTIAVLALPGLLLATVVSGVITFGGIRIWGNVSDFSWGHAFLFGAIVAATDPISVLALFKELGVTRRLSLIVEGESIFNDGVAVVLFGLLLGVIQGGEYQVLGALRHFVVSVVGGGGIGVLLGLTIAKVMSLVDDHLIEITLTTVLAFSAYLLAEHLHVSGVMAVIGAGLMTGNYSTKTAMSPTTRISVSDFWEYAAFAVNSVLFLMIGIEVKIVDFGPLLVAVLVAVAAMLIGRVAAVFLTAPLVGKVDRPLPKSWQGVLVWGGIRGAICMVLALSLPLDLPVRQLLMTMIFAVVIFTLLVQGLSMKALLRRLGLIRLVSEEAYEAKKGELYALGRALDELEQLASRGILSQPNYEFLAQRLHSRLEGLRSDIANVVDNYQNAVADELHRAEERLLHTEKDGIKEAYLAGIVSEPVMKTLISRVDEKLYRLTSAGQRRSKETEAVNDRKKG